jgi:hypothetical protein
MTVGIVGARYFIGQRVLTLKGPGAVMYIEGDDESVFYHVKLDNDRGQYIFGGSEVFDLIKKELKI